MCLHQQDFCQIKRIGRDLHPGRASDNSKILVQNVSCRSFVVFGVVQSLCGTKWAQTLWTRRLSRSWSCFTGKCGLSNWASIQFQRLGVKLHGKYLETWILFLFLFVCLLLFCCFFLNINMQKKDPWGNDFHVRHSLNWQGHHHVSYTFTMQRTKKILGWTKLFFDQHLKIIYSEEYETIRNFFCENETCRIVVSWPQILLVGMGVWVSAPVRGGIHR